MTLDGELDAHTLPGLTEAEAASRLRAHGYNELPAPDRRTPFRIVLEVMREPMLALLLVGGGVYLLLGDLKEAVILIAFAGLSVVITVVQEGRTERVLEALRDLSSPRALVIREGRRRRIAGRDVVPGDLLVLSEGDRVPADATLIESRDLQTDESLLTGESVPVRKVARGTGEVTVVPRPGGDDLPTVFSGSLVVAGSGIANVAATGGATEIGRIGLSISSLDLEPPRLQAQTRRLVRIFAVAGLAVSGLAVVLYGTLRGGWLDAVLAGIALGMSMLPEEFPVVLAVFMAMGAWRISRVRVLTRRASAIETLGSATVLCTDKTGTLTENRMSIVRLCLPSGEVITPSDREGARLPESFHELVEVGVLASARDPFDPMEKAFHGLARQQLAGTQPGQRDGWTLEQAYGLGPELLAMTHVWRGPQGSTPAVVAAKGAPEAIAALCHLGDVEKASLARSVESMAGDGLRVLGVARATWPGQPWPETQHDFAFQWLGLVGLADPLRASVPAAVRACRAAGIRVVMITGDYPATAATIAAQAGLDASGLVTGSELETLSDPALAERARVATVFARVMPEQKLRIVNALKSNGEIVAMTGDGVNDAPSLKAAHIGIAMGGRGTDVAREASAIVLLDDDFESILASVRLGRRIYDNLRKAMGFIFAVHVPIAGLALLPLAFGYPILFGPMHIAFLEMVIDPVCSLVFEAEAEEEDVMGRPPRAPETPLFSGALVAWGLLQGLAALACVAVIFVVTSNRGMPDTEVRALTFVSLIAAIVSLILVNRSFSASLVTAFRRPNAALAWVLPAVGGMLALTLLWPVASRLFRFGPLHLPDLALSLASGLFLLGGLELLKPLWRGSLRS